MSDQLRIAITTVCFGLYIGIWSSIILSVFIPKNKVTSQMIVSFVALAAIPAKLLFPTYAIIEYAMLAVTTIASAGIAFELCIVRLREVKGE